MDSVVVNRIGLLLTFLAGFLLAPELIGVKRLSRFEEWLERTAKNIAKNIQERRRQGIKLAHESIFHEQRDVKPEEYTFARSAKAVLGFYVIPLIAGTLALIFIHDWLVRIFLAPLVIISWIFYFIIFVWGGALLLLRLLRGNNRLKTWMIVLGLLIYIVGNLLQFWATF